MYKRQIDKYASMNEVLKEVLHKYKKMLLVITAAELCIIGLVTNMSSKFFFLCLYNMVKTAFLHIFRPIFLNKQGFEFVCNLCLFNKSKIG